MDKVPEACRSSTAKVALLLKRHRRLAVFFCGWMRLVDDVGDVCEQGARAGTMMPCSQNSSSMWVDPKLCKKTQRLRA